MTNIPALRTVIYFPFFVLAPYILGFIIGRYVEIVFSIWQAIILLVALTLYGFCYGIVFGLTITI